MPQAYSTNTGLGLIPEFDSLKNPAIFNECTRLRAAIANLQGALDRYTGAIPLDTKAQGVAPNYATVRIGDMTRMYVIADANLSYGQMIDLFNSSGTLKARKASAASVTTRAKAFVSSTSPVTAGNLVEVKLIGVLAGLSGLIPAAPQYLSDFAGYISPTPGTNPQYLGFALSATELFFNPEAP